MAGGSRSLENMVEKVICDGCLCFQVVALVSKHATRRALLRVDEHGSGYKELFNHKKQKTELAGVETFPETISIRSTDLFNNELIFK